MRRMDRKLEDALTMELLKKGEVGVMAVIDPQGRPYGVPLHYVVVNGNIYVHAALEGKKLQCIAGTPSVCFTVVGATEVLPEQFSTRYESVIVFGDAVIVEDEKEKRSALLEIVKKYSAGFMEKGMDYINRATDKTVVVRIIPVEITGKKRT